MTAGPILAVDVSGTYGGAQRSFAALVTGLHGRGHDVVCAAACPFTRQILGGIGVRVESIPAVNWRRRLSGFLSAVRDLCGYRRWLAKTCRRLQPSLIYANGLHSAVLMTGFPKAPPMVFHHRDCQCLNWLLRRAVEPAARAIVLSDFMAEVVRRQLPQHLHGKLKRVYNGIDFSALATVPAICLPVGKPCLLQVADLVDWKRHDLFLEAVAHVRKRCPNTHGIIVGGARDRAGLRLENRLRADVAVLGLTDAVEFVGALPSALPYIKAADVLCSTATEEPFGRTVLEAIGLGTPVVATIPGGPEEILSGLDHCACVAPDPQAVAAAAEQVAGSRVEPSAAWQETFSIEQHVKQIEETIADVLQLRV